jgi:NADH dehydrogenase
VGAGFGGLAFCQSFPKNRAEITLVDRHNHHLFQPLLYQLATAGLSDADIAQPVRAILANRRDITVLLDEAKSIDLSGRTLQLSADQLPFDYLVLALGGVTNYFGHPEWEKYAPGLKSLKDANRIRSNVLLAFEQAENHGLMEAAPGLLNIVVIGGGATGVEMAGSLVELSRHVLRRDFRRIDPSQARIILLEGGSRLLPAMDPALSEYTRKTLEKMGVEVRLNAIVKSISHHRVETNQGTLHAANIIWAAGVKANPLLAQLGLPTDPQGRVEVLPDLSLPGHPAVFAIGDNARVQWKEKQLVPGVSPAAMQMGAYVARKIVARMENRTAGNPFSYWDKGTMATIGRTHAVAQVARIKLQGFAAWLAWLGVHLLFLVGFRNKLSVLLNWGFSYLAYRPGARIIPNSPTQK